MFTFQFVPIGSNLVFAVVVPWVSLIAYFPSLFCGRWLRLGTLWQWAGQPQIKSIISAAFIVSSQNWKNWTTNTIKLHDILLFGLQNPRFPAKDPTNHMITKKSLVLLLNSICFLCTVMKSSYFLRQFFSADDSRSRAHKSTSASPLSRQTGRVTKGDRSFSHVGIWVVPHRPQFVR